MLSPLASSSGDTWNPSAVHMLTLPAPGSQPLSAYRKARDSRNYPALPFTAPRRPYSVEASHSRRKTALCSIRSLTVSSVSNWLPGSSAPAAGAGWNRTTFIVRHVSDTVRGVSR